MPNDLTLPLGLMDSGKLVVDPFPNLSRLVVGPSGAWKTTTTVTTTNQALIAYPDVAVKTVDHKDGEVYAQFRPVAKKYDRIFGCIDDMGVYGFDNEDRLEVNALGAVISAAKHSPETLTFTINNTTLNIIPEVNDGGYQGPRVRNSSPRPVEIIKRNQAGFEVLPKRWVVERTFAWLGINRRLARDFERYAKTAKAFIQTAMIKLMVRRLARYQRS